MVAKVSLKRLLFVLFLFSTIACIHFLISIQHLPDTVEKQTIGRSIKKNISQLEDQVPEKDSTTTETAPPIVEKSLRWFFKGGSRKPKARGKTERRHIWPEEAPHNDRIVDQLMSMPRNYNEKTAPLKSIVLWHGLNRWVKPGQQSFLEAGCPVNRCSVSDDQQQAATADAILFKDHFVLPGHRKPPNQVWIIYLLECPHHTERLQYNDLINWTATYRTASDIVTPYEKWVYYNENVKQNGDSKRNYAANKTHQVAWFVSNCHARNNRLQFARELQKHIPVDIYGSCGSLRCPRTKECYRLLDTKYKFYLAFENSNCVDYITEKLFFNGLQHDILPIVMGARPEDYALVAPRGSYIHVDDFTSAQQLAEYLLKLDANDDLYNSYFRWKGTGEFINTHFFCRLCALLHEPVSPRSYPNLNKWWRNVDTCMPSGPWRKIT